MVRPRAARRAREADFEDFVVGSSHSLRRTAFLMCGDWHRAEDIVQAALIRVYLNWRRNLVTAAGGATVAAGLVTAAVAVPAMLGPGDTTLVPSGPSTAPSPRHAPTTQPAEPDYWEPRTEQQAANRQAVLDVLPDGFVEITSENRDEAMGMADLAMAVDPPAADGLPDGMSGGVSLMTFPAAELDLHSGWCEQREEKRSTVTACSDHPVGQAVVKTQEWSRTAGGKGGAWESIRTTYEQPDGDAVVLDLYAWEDDRSTTPDRQEAAQAWLESMHEQSVHVVLDPAIEPPARVHPRASPRRRSADGHGRESRWARAHRPVSAGGRLRRPATTDRARPERQ